MLVSVVVCTYEMQMYDHFCEAADSVLDQSHDDVELVVVVDGDEAVFDRVQTDYGPLEDTIIHCNDENVGLLQGRNNGAELATGDLVAFMDDDAVAEENWVAGLVSAYQQTDHDAVGGRINPIWVADKPVYLPEEFYWLVGVTHRGFADGPGEVRNTFGSNLCVRRDLFVEMGGFDTEMGGRQGDQNLQGGETEFCARLQAETGRGVWYSPEAIVSHKVFEYRTDPRWLMDRAFWQGYSKRAMEILVPRSSADESDFLWALLGDYCPDRIRNLPETGIAGVTQLLFLLLLTAAVGAGYCYAFRRWR